MTRSIVYGASVDIDMGANPVTNVADPTNDQDAATKKYVDDNTGGGGVTYGTPAVALGTAAAAGSIDEAIRRDSTIVAFDATAPSTQAFGDAAAAGTAAVAARRDHKHAMPAAPTSVSGNAGTATALQTARHIDGQSFDGTADITVIAPGTHAATGKSTPVDADELALVDSAASNVLKKLTFSNLKATLKTYFDTLYAPVAGAVITKVYLSKPAGNITRASTSIGSFSTAWQITGVVVAAGQNVRLRMNAQCFNGGSHDDLFAFFRGATQLTARVLPSPSAGGIIEMEWVDENPGAGTYTYEVEACQFVSGTLTVYQGNSTTDAVTSGGSIFVAEVYTP